MGEDVPRRNRALAGRSQNGIKDVGGRGGIGTGVLFSSGLIAGGAITGVLLAVFTVLGWDSVFNFTGKLDAVGESALAAMVMYVLLLSVPLYRAGTRE